MVVFQFEKVFGRVKQKPLCLLEFFCQVLHLLRIALGGNARFFGPYPTVFEQCSNLRERIERWEASPLLMVCDGGTPYLFLRQLCLVFHLRLECLDREKKRLVALLVVQVGTGEGCI